jgi:transcription antitermination factor NusA-like protein
LSPARVSAVEVIDLANRSARVTVPDYQLSLAIGREGQNARLAARLTGWRIDIRSDNPSAPETVVALDPNAAADDPRLEVDVSGPGGAVGESVAEHASAAASAHGEPSPPRG